MKNTDHIIKKHKLKFFALLPFFALPFIVYATQTDVSAAANSGVSGTCDWSIDDSGTLTIGKDGGCTLADSIFSQNASEKTQPWNDTSVAQSIKKVKILPSTALGKTAGGLFYGLENLTAIEGLTGIDTSNTTDMTAMFDDCDNLSSLDLASFDTSKVTEAAAMIGSVGANVEGGAEVILGPKFKLSKDSFSDVFGQISSGQYNGVWVLKDSQDITSYDKIQAHQASSSSSNTYVVAYKTIYDANGGTFSDGSSKKEVFTRVWTSVKNLDFIQAKAPTRQGTVFKTWTRKQNDASSAYNSSTVLFKKPSELWGTSGTLTLYAYWENTSTTDNNSGANDSPGVPRTGFSKQNSNGVAPFALCSLVLAVISAALMLKKKVFRRNIKLKK